MLSNLQLGSRVQWITPHEIAFNTMRDDSAVTCVLNIQNMEECFYDGHLFDSFKNNFYVGLDFNQLTKYQPEYGYDNLKSIKKDIFIKRFDNEKRRGDFFYESNNRCSQYQIKSK